VRIYKTYGSDAAQLISENPYRLARDIRGIGFRTADQIAGKLGIEKTALIRVRAGIAYALTEAMDEGHCGLPAEELIPLTQTLLEVPAELVETALDYELEAGAVIADDLEGRRCVFLAGLYRAEREIAERLKALTIGRPPWSAIEADKVIPWVEQRTKLALADSQREAVRVGLTSKVLVITGGPGVGKTTLVNSILKILLAKIIAIALCAPTGRAAKRRSESLEPNLPTRTRVRATRSGQPRPGRKSGEGASESHPPCE
jgi:exodeoxyribonuclease V alpha subunit